MSYGQYSEDGVGRLTLSEIVPYGARDARKAGHNRATYTDANGVRRFRLIGTDVVTYDPASGRITINTGGYSTVTTRTAIAQGFEALGLTGKLAKGWIDPDGKPAKYPPHPMPDGWAFRPVVKPGVFRDSWRAQAWGESKFKGEGGNGFTLGPNGAWSGAEGNPIRVHFRRTVTLQVRDGGAVVVEIDGEPCDVSRAA